MMMALEASARSTSDLLADGADAGVDDPHPHFVVGQLFEGLLDGFGRALNVGLDHDGQLLHIVLGHLGEQVIQGDFLEGGELLFTGGGGALLGYGLELGFNLNASCRVNVVFQLDLSDSALL